MAQQLTLAPGAVKHKQKSVMPKERCKSTKDKNFKITYPEDAMACAECGDHRSMFVLFKKRLYCPKHIPEVTK